MAKIIAVVNEKGGVGKTATATTLAYLLSKRGYRTALIDFDGQGHSSIIFGVQNTNKLEVTINTLLRKLIEDQPLPAPESYIIQTESGVDLVPSNTQLFTLERNLCNVDFRERILSQYVDTIKDNYEYKRVVQRGGIIYLLYVRNTDAGQNSMRLVGASADFGTFCTMIASCVFKGNMEYRGESGLPGFRLLHHDYRGGRIAPFQPEIRLCKTNRGRKAVSRPRM